MWEGVLVTGAAVVCVGWIFHKYWNRDKIKTTGELYECICYHIHQNNYEEVLELTKNPLFPILLNSTTDIITQIFNHANHEIIKNLSTDTIIQCEIEKHKFHLLSPACERKDKDIVEFLLSLGSIEPYTKFCYRKACETGNPKIVEILQSECIDIRELFSNSSGADVISWLPELIASKKKFDPNSTIHGITGKESILLLACLKENVTAVRSLLSHPQINPNRGRTIKIGSPLQAACTNEKTDILQLLLNHPKLRIPVGNRKLQENPLLYVCRTGKIEFLRILLGNPRIIHYLRETADMMERLLFAGNNQTDIQMELLKHIPDNQRENKLKGLLSESASNGNLELVQILLEDPVLQNDDPEFWNTPENPLFGVSFNSNNENVMEVLLNDSRFDPSIVDAETGNTPLHCVCSPIGRKKHTGSLALLLQDERIDINAKDKSGATAIENACTFGFVSGVKLLLKDPRLDISPETAARCLQKILSRRTARNLQEMADLGYLFCLVSNSSPEELLNGISPELQEMIEETIQLMRSKNV